MNEARPATGPPQQPVDQLGAQTLDVRRRRAADLQRRLHRAHRRRDGAEPPHVLRGADVGSAVGVHLVAQHVAPHPQPGPAQLPLHGERPLAVEIENDGGLQAHPGVGLQPPLRRDGDDPAGRAGDQRSVGRGPQVDAHGAGAEPGQRGRVLRVVHHGAALDVEGGGGEADALPGHGHQLIVEIDAHRHPGLADLGEDRHQPDRRAQRRGQPDPPAPARGPPVPGRDPLPPGAREVVPSGAGHGTIRHELSLRPARRETPRPHANVDRGRPGVTSSPGRVNPPRPVTPGHRQPYPVDHC